MQMKGTMDLETKLERQLVIGGSEVGVLFGVSPWAGINELWLAKHHGVPVKEEPRNDQLFWGNALEGAIAWGFTQIFPGFVVCPGGTYRHPKSQLATALDYEIDDAPHGIWELLADKGIGGRGALEVKNISGWSWKNSWGSGVPMTYQLQLQAQMLCAGLEWGMVIALVDGCALKGPSLFYASPTIHAKIITAVDAFWALPPDHLDEETIEAYLRKQTIATESEPKLCGVELNIEEPTEKERLEVLADDYLVLGDLLKQQGKQQGKIKAELVAALDRHGADIIRAGNYQIKRTLTRGSREWKLVERSASFRHTITRTKGD